MMMRRWMFWGRRGLALTTALLVAGLWGAPAAHAADTTAPSAPTNLVLNPSDVSTDGMVDLDWSASASSDVQAYQIYRWYGSGTPSIHERTYVGETAQTYFAETLAREGQYRYTVVAVDEAGNKSRPAPWKALTVNKPSNGQTIATDTTAPGKPTQLTAAKTFADERLVDLSWTAPNDTDLWRFLVYRAKGNAAATFLAYVEGEISYYTDQVAADDAYTYYVMAQDLSGNVGEASASVMVTVDLIGPVVEITAPRADIAYRSAGLLAVTAKVTETGSGYEPDAVKIYFDGALQPSPVIRLDDLVEGYYLLEVEVTDRAGNIGFDSTSLLVSNGVAYDAPELLTDSGFSSSRSVKIVWNAPDQSGVTGYTIYRAGSDGLANAVGTVSSSTRSFSNTVPGDGGWSFYVVARYGSSKGDPSAAVAFVVDRVAPTVTIASPENGKSYAKTGRLTIAYAVTDAVSGADTASVKVLLDGKAYTGTSLSLSSLTAGAHTLKVIAADMAGNAAEATARFTVEANTNDDDDDEDDEDDEDDDDDDDDQDNGQTGRGIPDLKFNISAAKQAEIIRELMSHENEIHHGHYKSLLAKAQNGAWRSFVLHLYKHQGKFISRDAAEDLLELFDLEDVDIDARLIRDSEIEVDFWASKLNEQGPGGKKILPGKSGGHGRN